MLKKILFIANSNQSWLGGVYYIKNMIYQFLSYSKTLDNFDIYIYLEESVEKEFDFCKNNKKVKLIYKKKVKNNKKGIDVIDRNERLALISLVYKYKIDYIYPYFTHNIWLKKKSIAWLADFQHVYFENLFSKEEYQEREKRFSDVAQNHFKLILSSQDSYNTYCDRFPEYLDEVYVVPFVSFFDEKLVLQDNLRNIIKKYDIQSDNYFIVSNQFWQHKNHMVIVDALCILKEMGHSNIKIICTGATNDYRNINYFEKLTEKIEANGLHDNIKILGTIPREEQLQLMKGAIAVLQPSLFEGWGTVVEDAKTLGKITVMSDIEVHKEQKDSRSILFSKESPTELAEILAELWDRYNGKCKVFNYGISNAEEYGKAFMDAIIQER